MAAAKPHVLAVPLPAQGHLTPLMRLCKTLASHDILITFVNVDCLHERIMQCHHTAPVAMLPGAECNIRRARVPFAAMDMTNDFKLSAEAVFGQIHNLCSALVQFVSQQDPPITCILSDILLSSVAQEVADTFALPRIALNTCSQSMNLFNYHVFNGNLPLEDVLHAAAKSNGDLFHYALPGLPPLRNQDVPNFKHVLDETEYMYRFACREIEFASNKAGVIVVNSFKELEGPAAFDEMSIEVPVYPIGPLVEELSEQINTSLWKEQDDCLDWLDKQPADSVLYISFGSVTVLSELQFQEILFGLEASHQRFLWALRPDMVEGELPGWFLTGTSDRGYVVSWAPQMRVLQHASVSGFLTHCGWNSTMEAVVNGVTMLCWPYFSDQRLNCRLVVEEWKVGMRMGGKGGGGVVGRGDVEKSIRMLMEGEEAKVMRNNASKLSQKCRASMQPGGSSHAHMQTLVRLLKHC